MNCRPLLALSLIWSALWVTASAFAQPGDSLADLMALFDQPRDEFRPPTPAVLDALDANHDGELSAEEMMAASSRLLSLDKDKNGQLAADEWMDGMSFRGRGRRGPGGPGGPGGAGGPGGPGQREDLPLLARFDVNRDGMLDAAERVRAKEYLKEQRANGAGMFRGGPGGRRGREGDAQTAKPGRPIAPEEVQAFANADLYDPHILRTLFFVFENKDWEEELETFHNTDVDVPATLIVDGKTYRNVGVRFRGMSSYFGVPRGKKRSLNVSIDMVDSKQRLLGYKTLNLLNAHEDPSFLRTVLFNQVARQYVPAPQANLVRVVINGECWGIYANEEQFNKDFVKKWFGEDNGARWKVPPNFSGAAALVYHGDTPDDYRRMYELKAKHERRAWADLIELCKQLEQLPDAAIETQLAEKLNLDRAVWFLALDNVFMDGDGYFSRGSDYSMYQANEDRRFHLLPRDSNETFGMGGGPGGPGGPGGFGGPRGKPGPNLDPLSMAGSKVRPLVRLMAQPALRARYLAHVQTIVDEWLDWKKMEPVFEDYRTLIAEDVLLDTRNLSNFAEFFDCDIAAGAGGGPMGTPLGIRRFVEERRAFLLAYPALAKPRPTIAEVAVAGTPQAGQPVSIVVRVGDSTPAEQVVLYYAPDKHSRFTSVVLTGNGGTYRGTLPALTKGSQWHYYVEARAAAAVGTTIFFPRRAEMEPLCVGLDRPSADPKISSK